MNNKSIRNSINKKIQFITLENREKTIKAIVKLLNCKEILKREVKK